MDVVSTRTERERERERGDCHVLVFRLDGRMLLYGVSLVGKAAGADDKHGKCKRV